MCWKVSDGDQFVIVANIKVACRVVMYMGYLQDLLSGSLMFALPYLLTIEAIAQGVFENVLSNRLVEHDLHNAMVEQELLRICISHQAKITYGIDITGILHGITSIGADSGNVGSANINSGSQ